MSVKRSINTGIWSDTWVETLTPIEKLVWFYLLTNSYTNMLGIYKVSIKRIIFETGLTQSQIINALKGFERLRKAFYLFDEWIFLPNWIKNQSMNSNMIKSAIETYTHLPKELNDKLLSIGFESFESLSNGYQSLPNIEVELEDEYELELEGELPKPKPSKIEFKTDVRLTQVEYENFKNQYGETAIVWMCEKLSAYKESSGKKYKSDAGAIRSWVVDKWLANGNGKKLPDKTAEQNYIDRFTAK